MPFTRYSGSGDLFPFKTEIGTREWAGTIRQERDVARISIVEKKTSRLESMMLILIVKMRIPKEHQEESEPAKTEQEQG